MRLTFEYHKENLIVDLDKTPGGFRARIGGETIELQVVPTGSGNVTFLIGDRSVNAHVAADGSTRWVWVAGETFELTSEGSGSGRPRRHRERPGADARQVFAPMPGVVRACSVVEGDAVEKGQTLLLLEAMKMEIRVQAPRSGRIARLSVHPGQTVERDQALAEIEDM